MPKINATHKLERIQKRIAQLENDEALEARDINALLTPEQQQELKDAWAIQQQLRKNHKPPKTDAEKNKLGWKTIREVRLDVYRNALACLDKCIALKKRDRKLRKHSNSWSKLHKPVSKQLDWFACAYLLLAKPRNCVDITGFFCETRAFRNTSLLSRHTMFKYLT